MNLEELLKKLRAGEELTAEEIAFINDNVEELSDEDKAKLQEVVAESKTEVDTPDTVEEDEDLDEKALAGLIQSEVKKAVAGASKGLAKKQAKEAQARAEQMARDIETARAKGSISETKDVEADTEVRNFITAVIERDTEYLKKAVSTSSTDNAKGGYTIPEVLEKEILRLVEDQYGIARREMKYMPFSGAGNTRTLTSVGALSVFWTTELGKITSTEPQFGKVTQTLKKLTAIVPMSDEVIADSAINLTALVAELFAEAIAKEEDNQYFDGDGTVWTGVLRNADIEKIDLPAGKLPADVTIEVLQDVVDALPSSARGNVKWYMHRSVFGKIKMLKDGSGNYIFPDLVAGRVKELLGFPVVLSDSFPSADIVDTTRGFILFGNLGKGAIFGDKAGIKISTSTEATIRNVANNADIHLWEEDATAIRVVRRTGFVVAQPQVLKVLRTGA